VTLDSERLGEGDGAALSGTTRVAARAEAPATLLLFDLA
jgi:hypothetical protein